jgi:hypothetical protein
MNALYAWTRSLLLTLAWVVMVATAAQATPVAIIADSKGSVTLGAQAVKPLTELSQDALLDVAAGGRASIMFMASGKEFNILGPGQYRIAVDSVKAVSGAAPVARSTAWRVSTDAVVQVNKTAPASIRMRSIAPPRVELVAPRDGKLAHLKPRFQWQAGGPNTSVEFSLVEDNRAPVISARAQGEVFDLPANVSLQPGKTYRWTVRRSDAPQLEAEGTFVTASNDELKRLAKVLPKEKAATSDWVMYALTLHEIGAHADARQVWDRLAKTNPAFADVGR